MNRILRSVALLVLGVLTAGAAGAQTQNATKAGNFIVEPATLISLGFEWRIAGDDNRNAHVDVAYRKKGETAWRTGLPLMRSQNEQVGTGAAAGAALGGYGRYPIFRYNVPNMFIGSILNLEPDTDYEAKFTLVDPDGGNATKTVTAHTRREPAPVAGGHVYHVYPVDWTGPRQEPSFIGLLGAYLYGTAHNDYSNAFPPRVKPGDVILVHAGLYISDQFHYLTSCNGTCPPGSQVPKPGNLGLGTLFDGTYYLNANGTPDKPIVIKAAGDGEVIFDGNGAQTLFNMMAANYNYFEGITVRNTNVAFLLGLKGIAGASGFTLKHSKIYNVGRVVQDDWSGSKDFYIADNDLDGRHDHSHMMGWSGAIWQKFPDYPETMASEYAIKLYGQGHVVAYNHITNWHDGIDVATYGRPDGVPEDGSPATEDESRFPEAIDFYGNDIYNMGDNCVETDGGGRNVRVFKNRCFNIAAGVFSVQPGFGGPIYFYDNLVYNSVGGVFKYIEGSAGILTYNNTFVGEGRAGLASNMSWRNNLILAQSGAGPVFGVSTFTNYTSSDYNGFKPNSGVDDAFEWNSPPFEQRADYSKPPSANRHYKSLADYGAATGQDKHSVLLDYDVFQKVAMPDKTDPQRLYEVGDYDFRLKPGSAAVDAGVEIPNITDGFTGKAPDLGAYEVGQTPPHYGPRPVKP